ncbi:DNA-directed DNA polymerase [Candidatus Pyrohabitans sp.]
MPRVLKGFLVDADYETVEGRALLRLYLRTERGDSFVVCDDSFSPYFYALPGEDPEKVRERILASDREGVIQSITIEEKRFFGTPRVALRITVRHPQEVPRIREHIRHIEGVDTINEHDILFVRRYLIDRDIKPLTWLSIEVQERQGRLFVRRISPAEGEPPRLKVAAVDIEVYNPLGAPRSKVDPIIMVSIVTSDGMEKVLTWKPVEGETYVETLESEKDMLQRFAQLIGEGDYDVIVGYNTDSFDFPYIRDRVKKLGISLPLGRLNAKLEVSKRGALPEARIRGRAHVDLYPIVRRHVKLNSYVLESVVEELLGIKKEKLDADKLFECWDAGGEDLARLTRYSLEDARVTLALAEKFLPLYYELSTIVGQSLNDVARMTSGQLVEWLLMRFATGKGEIIPNHPAGKEYAARARMSYIGGYVREPKRGLVEDIAVFDFRSLYPSIIVSHNIDPSTLIVGDCEENRAPGLEYCFSLDKEGFIPAILKGLIKRRAEIKQQMKQATGEQRHMLDVSQQALKILANSFYGYMGYPRARWYRRECAESVAAFARMYIKRVMQIAEKDFNLEVVYGDTDSLFVLIPPERREVAQEFLNKVNTSMPGMIELEFEGFYRRGLFVTKKRYALLSEDGKMVVKGLEFVRRDWAPIARETQREVLRILLEEANPEKAARLVRDVIQRIRERRVTLDEITIYTQLTKRIKSYKGLEPHVVAAKKLKERGREVAPGMIIGYIITRGPKSISHRALPAEFAKLEDYDPEYYIDNQILPAIQRIFEAMGYTRDYLKEGITQTSLRKWF